MRKGGEEGKKVTRGKERERRRAWKGRGEAERRLQVYVAGLTPVLGVLLGRYKDTRETGRLQEGPHKVNGKVRSS